MKTSLEAKDLAALREEINQIPDDQPAALLEKIKDISTAFAGRDFKIARNLHDLEANILTDDDRNAENFNDIRGKLLYLLEQVGKL